MKLSSIYISALLLKNASSFIFPKSKQIFGKTHNDWKVKATLIQNKYSEVFGGDLREIRMEGESNQTSFVSKMSVPTFAVCSNDLKPNFQYESCIRKGLEGIIPGAFLIENALSSKTCEEIIETCENDLFFGSYEAGKNNHGAMQILVSKNVAESLMKIIGKHIDISSVTQKEDERIVVYGINRRWRIYKYNPDTNERFAPHIDAAFPGSGLSNDEQTLIWDDYNQFNDDSIMSRLTVLLYLNDDFCGGHTNFYTPLSQQTQDSNPNVIASIQPKTGSILIFPQGQNEEQVEYARQHWPTHEGTPVFSSKNKKRPKYVIRSDVLFGPSEKTTNEEITNDPMFQYDNLVRNVFLPKSPIYNPLFLSHVQPLYNPHMGVESIGPLLHSFIRFTKVQTIVEIGAGYTTPWILQALHDNESELNHIQALRKENKCRLLNYPWTVPKYMNQYDNTSPSLLCVDNCLHQRETATGAMGVARALNLDSYIQFIEGDAFALEFQSQSVDLLWCDFGVGSQMKEFISGGAWDSIRPGGFLICHSTLTNESTRNWLEAMRQLRGRTSEENEDLTGLPLGEEFVEISFLEPHKHYQNSISIFQRRGKQYAEPIYSQYA